LIALGRDRRALTSSFEYLIMGTLGATFILIGIGLLYMMTGTLNLVDMSVRLEEVSHTNPVIAAFAFITLGLAMKIALFPVHIWLTNAYAYAPSFVSAFLSATATKVMIYVFIRLIYDVFGQDFSFAFMPLSEILITLAILGIVVGSVTAVYQQNVKRLLAFSSVAQLGYMTLALGLATETGLVATIVHLSNHALSKGLLFLCVGAVVLRVGGSRVDDFNGVAKQMPLTMAAFVLGGFSLIGMPLTAGFISKWYLLQALLEEGHIALVIVLLISSLLAIVYIWRVVEAAYFKERDAKAKKLTEAPLGMLISMAVLVCANIYFGVMTDFTLGFARDAASQLFHGGL
jgi:multicomponent Na+:H+ antiporter subunit D